MNWLEGAAAEAASAGDYGRVIELARDAARMTQRQLAEACGLSQPTVSRLEKRGVADYNMKTLAKAARHLGIPLALVGLADARTAPPARADRASPSARAEKPDPLHRRRFLAGAIAAATIPAAVTASRLSPGPEEQAEVLRGATSAFRRMDASVSARQLADAVQGHLRLVRSVAAQSADQPARARLASVTSEVASFSAWLSWDMADAGSARTWYGEALRLARRSGDELLIAYQQGSLAQFEVEAGNAAQGLGLIQGAWRLLEGRRPAIAAAWLRSLEAVAHATAGDQRAAERALAASEAAAGRVRVGEEPPWPWVFTFDQRKLAAARVIGEARLARPHRVLSSPDDAQTVLTFPHEKQRAMLGLDVARGHLAAGRLDVAYAVADPCLDTGLRLGSGRVIEGARAFRRGYASTSPPAFVRDFDLRLRDAYR
ncbi:helix-turn-helix domain-containing protein [Streptomyces jumonjinensis]|uniref:helix-turn-helix domain-containing protein n=1 Tax=Streptomyces jumonjinensis TaxID=1945 RepID=UPI0037AE3DF9